MNTPSRIAFAISALIIILGDFLYYPKWNQRETEATISWDVSGYYLYLPAVFIYGDLKELHFADSMISKYRFASEVGAFQHLNGNRVIKYSCGQAFQFLPWFLLGHYYALVSSYPADGFSQPYQAALSMGSLFIAILGLWFLRLNLLKYFSDTTAAVTLILISLATNYLEYTAFHGALTHNWLFTIYAILIYCTIRFYEKPSWNSAIAIGILIGWATLTRPTDLVSALIPVAWGVSTWKDVKTRLHIWRRQWTKVFVAGLLAFSLGLIQVAYWKYVAGEWIVYSYQKQGFSWLDPHLMDGLFSYKAGWLIYTPVMLFALTGIFVLAKQYFNLFPTIFIFCGLYIYITFSWDIWWYGGSLGQRALVQIYPVWAISMAALTSWVLRQHMIIRIFGGVTVAVCLAYNIWLTHQAHEGGLLKTEEMTGAYFWKILGKNKVADEALKLLDNDFEYTGKREAITLLYFNDFETDSIICPLNPIQGRNALYLSADRQFSPIYNVPLPESNTGCLRVMATFYCLQTEWDVWRMAQMIVRYTSQGMPVKDNVIRVHRLLSNGQTRTIFIDSKVPELAYDAIQVFFWNADGRNTLIIDNLQIESFQCNN